MTLPNMKKPCSNCPFRKDSLKAWLGKDRMSEIIEQPSFTCHKTNKEMQCAGHMILLEERNQFYRLANRMNISLNLTGKELVFDNEEDCINHHKNRYDN